MSTQSFENSYKNLLFAQFYEFIVEKLGIGSIDLQSVKFCAKNFGDPILEIGCGTGLKILPLAEMGYSTVGLDNSPQMLSILQQKLEKSERRVKERVHTIVGEMTAPPIEQNNFRLIVFASSQFLHLSNDEQRLICLKSIYRLLADNGVVYIVNSKQEDKPEYDWIEQPVEPDDEWVLQVRRKWNSVAYQEDFKIISKIHKQQEYSFCWHLYPVKDTHMRNLIEQANLQCISLPSDLPTRPNSNIYLCKKSV
ncbi:class I SAM-dependent methyltransferase [Nodularia sphaerocarpa]|uniref:class I SAM-dependent methyltransferase n=1 Tax=Nodularia sphaerocarpa TaxID=137816 RepID=UPI00232D13DC|nr:class I SAM-dependent methyltransferase [Nodularia sphaerocarpa]MDB9372318.1 class I SAM-dependent methyltransferase [Nodularia sphaerocarpa CS-585]MDB9377934.1 class I SAM-dependent methyltransferase [Nodularia sphaerocarpa CS-585A2]